MCDIFRVQWTIIPQIAPRPWIACSGCGNPKPFESSGRIRLNANGKKLDAWLIYRCMACDRTWNRPIFERRNVRSINAKVLEAMQSNDPDWIRKQAFDVEALRRSTQHIEEFGEVDVHKVLLRGKGRCAVRLEITMAVPLPTGMRLDRLLATELGLSRLQIHAFHAEARLQIEPAGKEILRRRIRHQTSITLEIPPEADRSALWEAAAGRRVSD